MAANHAKGEVEVEIGGQQHTVRFTFGALRELKDHFGAKSITDVFKNAKDWGPDEIVVLFVAGLRRGSMPDATTEGVEELMLISELPKYAEAIGEALNASTTGEVDPPKTEVDSADPLATEPASTRST